MRKLWVVGVGPGAPDLLTLRAVEVLKASEVVFYPVKGKGKSSVALDTARPHIPDGVELVPLLFPMTKDREVLEEAWERSARTILDHPFSKASFITIGDPSIYSTYFYLHSKLADRIDIEFVPGVTSLSACCASMGMPLVLGDEDLYVASASHDPNEIPDVSTIVYMKLPRDRRDLESLFEKLKAKGYRVFFASDCQKSAERIVEGRIPEDYSYMAMLIAKR